MQRINYRPHPDPEKAKKGEKVKALIIDFKPISENWNTYELQDGTRVRIRANATQFDRALDPETGDILYIKGKPQYGAAIGVEIIYEFPEGIEKS